LHMGAPHMGIAQDGARRFETELSLSLTNSSDRYSVARMHAAGVGARRLMEAPADSRAPWELTSPAHACRTSSREGPSSGRMLR